jgi:hypothetical protein
VQGERTEAELSRMIERRSRKKDPEEASEAWQESTRRYNTRRRGANRLAWQNYFSRPAGSLSARAEEYDHRAQALMETDQPKGAA